jgi:hypothetical protein
VEDFMLDVMECYDSAHDDWLTRPMAKWRTTLDNDGQEFDCESCFLKRIAALDTFTPITVVKLRRSGRR